MIATVKGNRTVICEPSALVQGSVGQTLGLQLPGEWEGLSVTAVFSAGAVTRDVPVLGGEITIPWELLRDCGAPLTLCFHAAAADGQLVIATANCDPIRILPSAAPSGEEPEAPSPARADQIQALAQQAMAAAQSVCTQAAQGAFDGTDGVSPSLAVSEIEGGHRIVVTDAAGSRSFDVLDGTDGVDGEVTRSALAAALETKADVDGSYDDMSVGSAKQLAATVGVTDKVPYTFRTSGGTADIGDRETDSLVGGTIVWNQSFPKKSTSYNSGRLHVVCSSDGAVTVTVDEGEGDLTQTSGNIIWYAQTGIAGHKYLFMNFGSAEDKTRIYFTTLSLGRQNNVLNSDGGAFGNLRVACSGAKAGTYVYRPMRFDLTKMFGAAIADYVYSLERSAAGAGVAWFKKLFPGNSYAYNTGELMSVNASAHRTVGFNAWDEEVESGTLDGDSGAPAAAEGRIRSKNFIPVVGGAGYYLRCAAGAQLCFYDAEKAFLLSSSLAASSLFTVPREACFLKFSPGAGYGASYRHDICINLSWDGERDGEYAPYDEHSYALDGSLTLRGLLKLDANNNLYCDGDLYESDGTVTRLFAQRGYESGDESLADAVTDGTNTVYRLSAPVIESAEPYTNPQVVDDFGTEAYTDAAAAAGLREVAVPVGHSTRYMNNLRAKLEMMPSSPEGDGDYLVRQSGGTNSYVEYVDGGRIDALEEKLPSPPAANGSYRLTLTVSNGACAYAWTSV